MPRMHWDILDSDDLVEHLGTELARNILRDALENWLYPMVTRSVPRLNPDEQWEPGYIGH